MKQYRFIIQTLLVFLLLSAGLVNQAWATDVTYHILTLPINNSIYHMKAEISGKRLEAFKITVKGQSTLELPAQYKSPLATGFTYYATGDVTKSASVVKLFDATNNQNKGYTYVVKGEDTSGDTSDDAIPVTEGTTLPAGTAEYYVVYTYNSSNEIAELDGNVKYNIKTIGYDGKGKEVEKGFFAYNRGRNNRPAVLPKGKVDPEMLASEDFMKVDVTGTSVSPYWSSGDNKNKQAITGSQFHFMFEFIGNDPYNIIIRTAYDKDATYIEKNDNSNNEFVYKFYKEGSLFSNGTANTYFASDEHRHYNYTYNSSFAENPTNLVECASGEHDGWDARNGYYHGQNGTLWNSFALLGNSKSTGYVFMGTRTIDGSGNTPDAPYYLKEANTCNNLVIQSGDATNNLTIEGLYPIKPVTFKVKTPFGNTVSVLDQVSQYTVENDVIETKYLPDGLKRKYIEFNGKFYKDAAYTQEITKFSDAVEHPTEGYQVYVGYNVTPDAPKFLSPSADYTTATWYELTDEGSTQAYGRKIKNNDGVYKNNGANGEYVKESEFALVGDPYELKVLYRKGTEAAGSNSYVALSTHESWDMPDDDTDGSFLLREYNGTGHWYWDAGHETAAVTYQSPLAQSAGKDAQTIVFNLSGLSGSKYYKITVGGTDASQIVAVSPRAGYVYPESGTSTTVEVFLAENESGANKTMTVTIQEYNDDEGTSASGSSSVITITQGTTSSSFTPSAVGYSTTNSTRVKVLDLPTFTYTYNIVDKSGRIAVKASAEQTIFSKLSETVSPTLQSSLPSIIVSPFLVGETLAYYSSFDSGSGAGTGTSRTHLSGNITETPAAAANIYVTYTTAGLVSKPIMLNQDQEFNVVLNGEYIYYDSSDGGSIKSKTAPSPEELQNKNFLWKLRNRDPYAMLIDNKGARDALSVTGDESVTMYSDTGASSSETREKGAWVALESIDNEGVLSFTKRRSSESEGEGLYAQRFVAKASTNTGVYEVMVATGVDADASTTYYNIGRPTENTVKIYYNNTGSGGYAHGSDVLKFRLEQTIGYTYYLIDKSKHKLLTLTSQSPDLALPGDYQSPLVATYHFYDKDNVTETEKATGNEYEPKLSATELTSLSSLAAIFTEPSEGDYKTAYDTADAAHKHDDATTSDDISTKAKKLGVTGNHYYKIDETYYVVNVSKAFYNEIYVTYDVNDIVKFGNTSQYTLKFLEPFADGYYLEDGNDKLTTTKLQAVYPYTNGDGNLNIYGQAMKDEQMGGGASTRPRWVWYFNSTNNDPYHVRIHSRSTISYSGVSHPTYLQTYAVHFNQDTEKPKQERIVTGGGLPGVASTTPTEYMILGAQGAYKLMTTYPVEADLDGDGNTTGTGENERRKVTSLEQYWKTYNMAKLHVLDIAASTDAYSTDESTWVVPNEHRATLEARDWHSYDAYANATRWNGYNDKENGHEKKVVEKLEHWFQTFDMGNGAFDIESADIPPVLVLLDLHGWEIMRLPLPTTNYPYGETELAALRAYDSPLVDKYYFYSNASKASGCHKYSLRMQNGAERDQIKVNGERYSSTSLGDLPPITATGVKSGNEFNDQYVIYTVKEEYAKSYSYDYSAGTETASEFLMVQHGRFYKYENKGTIPSSYISKPIFEHAPDGGNVYDLILDPKNKSGNDDIVDGSGNWKGNCLWYVKPNQNIDKEMGIKYATTTGNTGEPWTESETKKYYHDNGKDGFDPYNIQIQLKNNNSGTADGRYLTSHMTSTELNNGIMIGDYSGTGGTTDMTLVAGYNYAGLNPLTPTGSAGYDHTNLTISNQTFMAVSDANGNMQLMPRFDHTKRVDLDGNSPWYTTLEDPVDHPKASADDNASQGNQTTFFVRPQRFIYKIIDNEGKESLRYRRGGDYYPAVTEHFRSPLAKDFTYYKGLAEHGAVTGSNAGDWGDAAAEFKRTATAVPLMNTQINLLPTAGTYYYQVGLRGAFTYYKVEVTKGLLEQEIMGSFAKAGLDGSDSEVIVRYDYDADADHDADQVLEGRWFTVKLANKDLQSSETRIITDPGSTQGTNVNLFEGTKPATVGEDEKVWQWKFLAVLANPISDYYEKPDPYNVRIYNRYANYTDNPSTVPNPMNIGIKVPNENSGADHFALLSHPNGGYALAVAGKASDFYTYTFLNGADMTAPDAGEPVAATTATEASFTQKTGIISAGSQLILNNDVKHNFVYHVINNATKLAVSATQDEGAAEAHNFFPYLPEDAQSPLLRMKDYKYYGAAIPTGGMDTPSDPSDDTYDIIPYSIVYTLSGGYDDVVWVHYDAYHVDSTEYKIPNKKTIVDSHVARDPESIDVSMNIEGGLPYNIIWYNDDIMQSTDESTISDGGSHALSGNSDVVWYFTGNDPYGLKIKHKGGKYVDGDETMADDASGAKEFMLLKKSGYDYGILQEMGTGTPGVAAQRLTGFGNELTTGDAPTKFIIFGLSIHDLIYRLVIAKTCELSKKSTATSDQYVDIPYSNNNPTPHDPDYTPATGMLRVYGSTQRDLESVNTGAGTHYAGEKYQLGETLHWNNPAEYHTYCFDAGSVSIGDDLTVPNVFNRPNCTFEFYIEGVYQHYSESSEDEGKPYEAMNNLYKGLKLDKLMADDRLINQDVVVNIVYKFDETLATNAGMDFVRSTDQNLWYTFETQEASVPQLARYTKTQGLTVAAGRETHYTNDYLFTPLGDVYGFKMYNRYVLKNNNETTEKDESKVMTTTSLLSDTPITIAEPGTGSYTSGNEIYELISGDVAGFFRVHPVANNSGSTVYLKKDGNSLKLSTTPQDWTYGLDVAMLQPYYLGAGNVGGLNAKGKAEYEAEIAKGEGEDGYKITDLQNIVYDDANIVHFTSGYYRLHSQPGIAGISPVRYASGYLHEIEKTAGVESTAIPLHFYSKQSVSTTFAGEGGLGSGFTETAATRGDIPIAPTENDPSTIFYVTGSNLTENVTLSNVTLGTQGLNVIGNKMGTGTATTYRLIDIGGGVVLLVNTESGSYLNFDQADVSDIYDLKYGTGFRIDDVKWCMEPANTLGLKVATNNGSDGYYYSTLYMPFDVLLPADADGKTYNAYVCKKWHNEGVNPVPVPEKTIAETTYSEGKFVPAGTPVIIRTNDDSEEMKLTLPSNGPTTSVPAKLGCVFSGEYLEQMLDLDASHDVYTLGLPFTSDVHKDDDYSTTGDIVAPLPEKASSGVGFYINATSNKEADPLQSLWTRNNLYVLHNKIYYRGTGAGVKRLGDLKSAPQFVPVLFGDEEEGGELQPDGSLQQQYDGDVYDLSGRKVATEEQVNDGTWKQILRPGIYIVGGKKIKI